MKHLGTTEDENSQIVILGNHEFRKLLQLVDIDWYPEDRPPEDVELFLALEAALNIAIRLHEALK